MKIGLMESVWHGTRAHTKNQQKRTMEKGPRIKAEDIGKKPGKVMEYHCVEYKTSGKL